MFIFSLVTEYIECVYAFVGLRYRLYMAWLANKIKWRVAEYVLKLHQPSID